MDYIKVKGLSKSYSDIKALKNLSIEIEAGTLFGILGPNGAGKSTLIKILATLIEPDSGEVFINNINLIKNSRKIRELIGYVAQDIALDKILTGRELLDFQAEDGIRDVRLSRGLGDVYKRQLVAVDKNSITVKRKQGLDTANTVSYTHLTLPTTMWV